MITDIETFIDRYVSFVDPGYKLPLALWAAGTWMFDSFEAFPYLVITSATKRSGKTRLCEVLSLLCSKPRMFSAMTGPTIYRVIEQEHPTIIFDEAETLSSEAASIQRSVLNVGYRKGQTIPRVVDDEVKEFDTFCPKVFALIGDVYDTLKDRSIMVVMHRAEAKERFFYSVAKDTTAVLREKLKANMDTQKENVVARYHSHRGLSFLTDRDEEIWLPLFAMAQVFCPSRIHELETAAIDMSTEKTAEARRFTRLAKEEDRARDSDYAERVLIDLYGLFVDGVKVIPVQAALDGLKAIPVAPWRKYRGEGLTLRLMASLLSRFGVHPSVTSRSNGSRDKVQSIRVYRKTEVEKAFQKLGK